MKDRTVKLQCPTCDRRLKVPNPRPNKCIVCPKCNARFRVDAQLRVVVDNSQNELFGPPVDAAMYDDVRLKPARHVRAAFEDIDHLFASGQHLTADADHARPELPPLDIKAAATAAEECPTNREAIAVRRDAPGTQPPPAPSEGWASQKKFMSKSDERFQRNGIGLLILAIGLAMLPFVGRNVEGLEVVLPWLPVAAMVVAMVGCFTLAWSLRRGKLTAVMLCALPLLLIGLLSAGGYLLNSWSASKDGADSLLGGLAANVNDLVAVLDQDNQRDNDGLAFEADEITDNAATKFVPPRLEGPLATGKKPAAGKNQNSQTDSAVVDRPQAPAADSENKRIDSNDVAVSTFRPAENILPVGVDVDSSDSEIESDLRMASVVSANMAKRNHLLQRRSELLIQGLVDSGKVRSPIELGEAYVLSATAGELTVYGIATFFPQPISGFDVAFPPDATNQRIDLLVPIVGVAEFPDSIASPNRSAILSGLKFNIQAGAIAGVQGQFSNPGQAKEPVVNSPWFGQPTADDRAVVISAGDRPVHGVVLYRNKLELVGISMILGGNRRAAK